MREAAEGVSPGVLLLDNAPCLLLSLGQEHRHGPGRSPGRPGGEHPGGGEVRHPVTGLGPQPRLVWRPCDHGDKAPGINLIRSLNPDKQISTLNWKQHGNTFSIESVPDDRIKESKDTASRLNFTNRVLCTWSEPPEEVALGAHGGVVGDDQGHPVLARPSQRPESKLHQEMYDGHLTLACWHKMFLHSN